MTILAKGDLLVLCCLSFFLSYQYILIDIFHVWSISAGFSRFRGICRHPHFLNLRKVSIDTVAKTFDQYSGVKQLYDFRSLQMVSQEVTTFGVGRNDKVQNSFVFFAGQILTHTF